MISILSLVVGTLVVALGLEGFLVPNQFIDGGVTGISMLLAQVLGWPLPILLVAVNLPFVLLGYRRLGAGFALKSGLAVAGLAICVSVLHFPVATHDKLLAAVFGGVFIGGGVGLAIRGGGVLDGTEILAVLLSKRTFATVGEVILALNVVIFAVAALRLGVEPAMYSALTYFTASRTIDFLLHGIEAYNGVMIVTSRHEPLRRALLEELGIGVTAFHAQGGFSSQMQQVLFCVVTRLQITRLETLVKRLDDSAFLVISPVLDASGGVLKHREHG